MPSTVPQRNIRLSDKHVEMARQIGECLDVHNLSAVVRHLILTAHREMLPKSNAARDSKKNRKESRKGD